MTAGIGMLALFLPVIPNLGPSLIRVPVVDGDIDPGVTAALLGGQAQGYRWTTRLPKRGRGAAAGPTPGYCWLYLLVDRELRRMPVNERAVDIGRRLGHADESERLLGPALVIGAGRGGGPADVPAPVRAAAHP